MANQATIDPPSAQAAAPPVVVRQTLATLASDLVLLAELQVELVKIDLTDAIAKGKLAVGLLLAGAVLAVMALPVLLLGVGWLLVDQADFSHGAAFLTVSLVAIVLGGVLAGVAVYWLLPLSHALDRSREEFSRNFKWIKDAISQQGR